MKQKLLAIIDKQIRALKKLKTASKIGSNISVRASHELGNTYTLRTKVEVMSIPADPVMDATAKGFLAQIEELESDKKQQTVPSLQRIMTSKKIALLVHKLAVALCRPMGDGHKQNYIFTSTIGAPPEGSERLSELRNKHLTGGKLTEAEAEEMEQLRKRVCSQLNDHPKLTVTRGDE